MAPMSIKAPSVGERPLSLNIAASYVTDLDRRWAKEAPRGEGKPDRGEAVEEGQLPHGEEATCRQNRPRDNAAARLAEAVARGTEHHAQIT